MVISFRSFARIAHTAGTGVESTISLGSSSYRVQGYQMSVASSGTSVGRKCSLSGYNCVMTARRNTLSRVE